MARTTPWWRQLSPARGALSKIIGRKIDRRLPPTKAEKAALRKEGSYIDRLLSGTSRLIKPKTVARTKEIVAQNLGDVLKLRKRVLLVPAGKKVTRSGELVSKAAATNLPIVQSIEGPTLKNWQWRHPGAYYNRRGFREYREHATHIITLPLNGREVQYRVDQSAYAILQDMRMRAWHRGTGLNEGQGSKVDYRVAITSIHRASGKLKDVNGGVIKWDDDPEAIRASKTSPCS